jgi:hypothetical protein
MAQLLPSVGDRDLLAAAFQTSDVKHMMFDRKHAGHEARLLVTQDGGG